MKPFLILKKRGFPLSFQVFKSTKMCSHAFLGFTKNIFKDLKISFSFVYWWIKMKTHMTWLPVVRNKNHKHRFWSISCDLIMVKNNAQYTNNRNLKRFLRRFIMENIDFQESLGIPRTIFEVIILVLFMSVAMQNPRIRFTC